MKISESHGLQRQLPFEVHSEQDRAHLQRWLSMTRKDLQAENRSLQEQIKDKDLKQLLVKVSTLSINQLADYLASDFKVKKTYKVKHPKKKQSKQEAKRLYNFLKKIDQDKHYCEKYLFGVRAFDINSQVILGGVKKLKKIILDQLNDIQSLAVYYSSFYPMLLLSYTHKQSPQIRNLREILNQVPLLRGKLKLFDDIFSQLYERVDERYYPLVKFALLKAKDLKMAVSERQLISESDEGPVMFYFVKGEEKHLNFIVFDKRLKYFEFNSSFVMKNKGKNPKEFQLFEELYNMVYGQQRGEQINDLLDRQEAESSDEDDRPQFTHKSLACLKVQLQQYLNKNLKQIEQTIQELLEDINIQASKDSSSDKMLQLTEQVEELEENKTNYEQVRDKVKEDIKVATKQSYVIALKKMIIAEKQMESRLPIIAKKRKIFQILNKQDLLIIEGETGSGKSTQFPQILCEFYQLFDKPDAKPVLVTQPRKLATRSLAQRVGKEMGEGVGGFVDYVASAGKKPNPSAKIIFKLDRLVLDELSEDPLLSKYSCLVIDEAHERTLSIDVILGLIKQLLSKRKDFKVIVTSASMDIQLFENYFKTKTLKVSGRMFPVTITYKDYANFKEGDKFVVARKIEKVINQEILQDSSNMKPEYRGHVLCFCSGVQEISELVRVFEAKLNKKVFTVLPLHGKISPSDQKKVFQATGKHKIIFASRIAETAITIDGVRVVIDPGLDIETVYDQKYKISSMKIVNISQSSAKQRAGRSGRTAPGHCFRLYSQQSFKKRNVCKVPQMENSSLQTVVLRLKSLKIQDVYTFSYVSKPDPEGLRNSVEILKMIGALHPDNQKITNIGEILVKIPIDPFLSRAIVEAIIYQQVIDTQQGQNHLQQLPSKEAEQLRERGLVYTTSVILSLVVNFSNLFFIRKEDRQNAEGTKFYEFSDEQGDFFFLDNIYRKYLALKDQTRPGIGIRNRYSSTLSDWMKKNYLNFKTLRQCEDLVQDIAKVINVFRLNELSYKQQQSEAIIKIKKCKSFRQLVLSCLISSFSSNLCKYSGNPRIGYTLVQQRKPLQIYGTSNLSLLGIEADWIISYDLYTNDLGRLYCKVAHKVSYQFIQAHTNRYIMEKYKISSIKQCNPFYEQLFFQLPTAAMVMIKADFGRSYKDHQLNFLQETNPLIDEQTNQVSFFILSGQTACKEGSEKKQEISLGDKIRSHINKRMSQLGQVFKHNYIGNIYVYLKDGFQVQNIQFDKKEYIIEAISIDFVVEHLLSLCGEYERREVYSVEQSDKCLSKFQGLGKLYAFKRAILAVNNESDKQEIIQYIEEINSRLQSQDRKYPIISHTVKILDHRKKIPRTKTMLHFFAGNSKGNIFMGYKSPDEEHNVAQEMHGYLKQCLNKLRVGELKARCEALGLKAHKIVVSKKRTGINIFSNQCDQFEVRQLLYKLVKANLLDFRFKYPDYITNFRGPEISEAQKNNQQWIKQVKSVLQQRQIDTQGLIINIRGYYYYKSSQKDVSELQRSFRVDMTAQIHGLSQSDIKILKQKVDGKKKILGCEKVHLRMNFDQVLAIPSQRLFYGLEEQYEANIANFKEESPMLSFHVLRRRLRNQDKMMIIGYSPNKQELINPQRIFQNLYSPRLIKLQDYQYNFLNKTSIGQSIMENIEYEYNYKVYFGFDKWSKVLKVYCDDNILTKLQQTIKETIKSLAFHCERISYRGKNLKKVQAILTSFQTSQNTVYYEIIFQKRQIEITSNLISFQSIKTKIQELTNKDKGQCEICAEKMKNPYKLANCYCIFCWHCISSALRQFFTSNDLTYYCPGEKCQEKKTAININDFKTLLSEEEFQKLCDLKIKRYIWQSKQQTSIMLCKFCENLLDKSDVEESRLNCEVCGRSWCQKCEQEHSDQYTCQQWQKRNEVDQKQLKALGVKKCPKCCIGIQKNEGCNHMHCKGCNAHICWQCLEHFQTSGQCYGHLREVHGRIQ